MHYFAIFDRFRDRSPLKLITDAYADCLRTGDARAEWKVALKISVIS